jgi:PTH2 family peptidyl-tRNA hydrolase
MRLKQVLVWRNDLRNVTGQKVRTGKIAAQLAHASMKVFFDRGTIQDGFLSVPVAGMEEWINGSFVKVAVKCNSEEELDGLYQQALAAHLPCAIIEDNGHTEFGGVLTKTAIAIGPADSAAIDKITGHLGLL